MSMLLALAIQAATQKTEPVAKLTQVQLNAMTDACKAPRGWLKLLDGDQIRFLPSPTAKYQTVDCVLKRLRMSVAPMKLGFIGNEQLSEDR